jgi:hypothetical protein
MTETPGRGSARRRRRASSRQGPPRRQPDEPASAAAARVAAEPPVVAPAPAPLPKQPRPRRAARDAGDGGLHELVGGGRSQLGVSGALRGRDVNRPTDDDLAEAERDVEIVRRHWTPPQ